MKSTVSQLFMPVVSMVAVTLFFSACNKEESKSQKELLTGSWTIVKTAHDDNNNGVADDGELRAIPATNKNIETFFSDGTGMLFVKDVLVNSTTYFQWQLVNGDQDVQVTPEGETSKTVRLLTLTETDLVTEDTTNPDGRDWIYAKRK